MNGERAVPARNPALPPVQQSFEERYLRWRNALVGSARFQAFANRFWPLRLIARKRARDLFSIVSGFIHSQILFACVETGLFALLATQPRSTAEIAAHLGMEEGQANRLLESALALKLIRRDRTMRWWLDDAGAVVHGNAGIAAMIRHHAMVYHDLADPVALLKDPHAPTRTQAFWSYVRGPQVSDHHARQYSQLMTSSQDTLIDEVLDAHDFSRHSTLLDIGGGEGAFLKAAGKKYPNLKLQLFDLPAVSQITKPGEHPVSLQRFAGNFFEDELPRGADCISLLRVVCDHEDDRIVIVLKKIHDALPPGGVLLVAEPMAGANLEQSLAAAYFGFYFLAMRSGRCRTPKHIISLMKQAGFSDFVVRPTRAPLAAGLVEARK